MISRRDFLKTGTVTLLLIPASRALSGCGGYSSSPVTGPTGPGCDGAGATSSVALSHTHTLCVPLIDLTSPPAEGRTYATSTSGAHHHDVTLSQQDLQNLGTGGSVVVTTTSVDAHTHTFRILRATSTQMASMGGPYQY
jgi:hypothetical protein